MKKSLLAGFSASLLCFALSAGIARAQDATVTSREGIALQNQILSLQSQLQQMQASVQQLQANGGGGNNGPAPVTSGGNSTLTTQLLQRVTTLEQQVRDLTGQLQQLQNQVATQNGQLTKQIGDLTFQMQNGGHAPAAGAGGAATAAAPATTLPAAVAKPTPVDLMQQGILALHQGNYKQSEGIARELLAKFPHSPRAYDAQFLLAQSLQGQQRYQQAALAFDDTYNRNHKGDKAPNALLGLAMTLSALNQKAAACSTLQTLHTQFPKPPAYLVEPIAATHKKLGC
jgi:tol-pal system protein YbgF